MEPARLMYLEQCCMLAELTAVATDHDDRRQGLLEPASLQRRTADTNSAAAALGKHLQAAVLMQHLQLPAVQAEKPVPVSMLGTNNADDISRQSDTAKADLIGNAQHIMGITPQSLRHLHLPSRKASQRAQQPLLPLLETRLKQHAQAAAAAVAGPTTGSVSSSQVVQQVQDKQAELGQLQQSNMQQLQALHAEAAAYFQELDSIHATLQQLVGRCMLEEQPKLDQVQYENTHASINSCISKLRLMQLQLWNVTYDSKTVQALTVISEQQQQMEQQLRSSIEQAEAQLQEYLQFGEDFQGIVQEYGGVLDKIQEVDSVLASLSAVEEAWSA